MGTGIRAIKNLRLFPTPLVWKQELAPEVFVLGFKREEDFLPGQVVGISHSLELEPRLYSIASGNKDESLEILFNVNPEGALTPILGNQNPGNILQLSKPFGSFTLNENRASYWIAAGTGIAPFRSYLRSGLPAPIELIHGGRQLQSFYFQDEFLQKLPSGYVRCCTQEKGENLYEGRLTNYLREHTALQLDANFYLCGSAEMVVEVRDILLAKGVSYQQIIAEIYF